MKTWEADVFHVKSALAASAVLAVGGGLLDPQFAAELMRQGGAVALGGLVFIAYRKDVKQYTELWKAQSEQLIKVVKENTSTQTRLVDVIEHLVDRVDRVDPIDDRDMPRRKGA